MTHQATDNHLYDLTIEPRNLNLARRFGASDYWQPP